jgi:hypothetical protein
MSEPVVCPICESPITNPPAKLDLRSGAANVLVHPECESRGLTPSMEAAIEQARLESEGLV